jgi:hypothetical protein
MKFVLFGFIWGAGFSMAVTAWLMDQNILTPNNASVIFSVDYILCRRRDPRDTTGDPNHCTHH